MNKGKRQSAMQPKEFQSIASELFPDRGAQKALAEALDCSPCTISNWWNGKTCISKIEARFLRVLLMLHVEDFDWQQWMRNYERGVRIRLRAAARVAEKLEDLI